MTLVHAIRLMAETFGGAVLMLGAVWTIVAVEERLRLLIDAWRQSPAAAVPTGPSSPSAAP